MFVLPFYFQAGGTHKFNNTVTIVVDGAEVKQSNTGNDRVKIVGTQTVTLISPDFYNVTKYVKKHKLCPTLSD